jgi:uncharacterized protein YjiS (DUF1127 family)
MSHTLTTAASAAYRAAAAAHIRTWWQAFVRRRRLRKTAGILESLDDRTLKDIGLDRTEIPSVVSRGCSERRIRLTCCN